MSNEAGPSSLPDENIVAFMNLTSSTPQQAAFYLEACSGQLDQAVARYYDDEGGLHEGAAMHQDRDSEDEAANEEMPENGHERDDQIQHRGRSPFAFLQGGLSVVAKAVKIAVSVVGYIGSQVLPGNIIRALQGATRSLTLPRVADPIDDAESFCEAFESQFGILGPDWLPTDWQDAAREAHHQFKLLFIYLHAPDHEETANFCRSVLCNGELASYVNEHFVSWGGSIRTSQAFQLSQKLRVTRYPYVCLLAYSGSRVRIAAYSQGPATPESLLNSLRQAEEMQAAQFIAERSEHQERELNRTLREEQDAAYQQSLREDMEREQQRQAQRHEEEEKERAEKERLEDARRKKEQEEQEAADKISAMQARQKSKAENLRSEPSGSEIAAAVRIRLPSGANCQRKFVASRPVQDIFDFVDSLEDFKVWEYNLVSSYPKKVLNKDCAHQSFEELHLVPQATLFVQSLDD